jgi:hypothetical protein
MGSTDSGEVTIIGAKFPAELRDALARSAQAHDRSFSGELREAARSYLRRSSSSDVGGAGGQTAPSAPLRSGEEVA